MTKTKIKKSHQWDIIETLYARCPYCRKDIEVETFFGCEGDKADCPNCKKTFKLGRQK